MNGCYFFLKQALRWLGAFSEKNYGDMDQDELKDWCSLAKVHM